MPHPKNWKGGQMPRSSPGGRGWAQLELRDALNRGESDIIYIMQLCIFFKNS